MFERVLTWALSVLTKPFSCTVTYTRRGYALFNMAHEILGRHRLKSTRRGTFSNLITSNNDHSYTDISPYRVI